MPAIIDQKNLWGKTLDPQRSDLWRIDMSQVILGLNEYEMLAWNGIKEEHYAQSVSFPEVGVTAEVTKRDSIPYQMPSFDEATGAITVVFILDVGVTSPRTSEIYKLLEAWRTLVRAGRGAVGTEDSVSLNSDFRIDFQFDFLVEFLAGDDPRFGQSIQLQTASTFVFQNAWLSKIKVSDASYESKNLATVTATFYADAMVEPNASQQISRGHGKSSWV